VNKASILKSAAPTLPSNFIFYAPGEKNPTDPKADVEANGFTASGVFNKHFSFVPDAAGKKVLKLDTLDGANDVFSIPLSGREKRITVIFMAKGAAARDTGTPYGAFWACWQRGPYQAVLRHNASNQIKGSTGQSRLNPDTIVSDWRDYRLVFEVADDGKAMTATAFIDGKQRDQTLNFEMRSGDGNYLQFGEGDGSTNGAGFNNGYVFRGCLFTADPGLADKKIYLGRGAWVGGSDGGANQGKVVVMLSRIHAQINPAGWSDWDNVSTVAKQFFREYKNSGEGAVSTESANRKLLTDVEYDAAYAGTEKILGYSPKMPY
jgi:hypothetical protein